MKKRRDWTMLIKMSSPAINGENILLEKINVFGIPVLAAWAKLKSDSNIRNITGSTGRGGEAAPWCPCCSPCPASPAAELAMLRVHLWRLNDSSCFCFFISSAWGCCRGLSCLFSYTQLLFTSLKYLFWCKGCSFSGSVTNVLFVMYAELLMVGMLWVHCVISYWFRAVISVHEWTEGG